MEVSSQCGIGCLKMLEAGVVVYTMGQGVQTGGYNVGEGWSLQII